MDTLDEEDVLRFPRGLVQYPIVLRVPPGFVPEVQSTWPDIPGRLELVGGRLEYTPPCGGVQQGVCVDLVTTLRTWSRNHPAYFIGGNEAGMILGPDVRGADGAVWSRASMDEVPAGFFQTPPILAAEVAGRYDDEASLRAKADWYFSHGVTVVWIILPESREVIVLAGGAETRLGRADRLPTHEALPGLTPDVAAFFAQLDAT